MFQHAAWGRRRAAPFRTMCARLNGRVDYSTLGKPCAIDDCTVHGKNCGGNAPDNGPAGTKGRPGGALPASTGNRRVSTRVDENRRRDEPATALTAPVSAEGPAGGGAPEVRSQSSRNAETGPGACGATRRREGHTKTRRLQTGGASRGRVADEFPHRVLRVGIRFDARLVAVADRRNQVLEIQKLNQLLRLHEE